MAWVFLLIAGFLEIVWAFTLKQSQGFTRMGPTVITIVALVVGVVVLGEPLTTGRVLAAVLIVGGLGLMKLTSSV